MPREQIMAEAARLASNTQGIKVVGIDAANLPDGEIAAKGGFLPGPHAKLAGPTFQEWLETGS
ncbi:hypothetical protein [Amycolatopsis sp. WAC 04197]|uniref:hypothetical protein n=1 Tax=Amycolatopsis sp. WAC 04197 TaxID=2203199 RepID=UPI000F775D71|nr:hypothetical protein [Amycolatopsis sp. WAC 04197]